MPELADVHHELREYALLCRLIRECAVDRPIIGQPESEPAAQAGKQSLRLIWLCQKSQQAERLHLAEHLGVDVLRADRDAPDAHRLHATYHGLSRKRAITGAQLQVKHNQVEAGIGFLDDAFTVSQGCGRPQFHARSPQVVREQPTIEIALINQQHSANDRLGLARINFHIDELVRIEIELGNDLVLELDPNRMPGAGDVIALDNLATDNVVASTMTAKDDVHARIEM